MKHPHPALLNTLNGLTLAAALVASAAQASEHERSRVPLPKPYVQECAACHLAYPPGMLPAASWGRLMTGLDQHFGTNASLDEKDVRFISDWLMSNADARHRASNPVPQDRITRTEWFQRKHRHIATATWRLPSVRSASNCLACHSGADRGQFDDDHLRMPAGLSARQRDAWED